MLDYDVNDCSVELWYCSLSLVTNFCYNLPVILETNRTLPPTLREAYSIGLTINLKFASIF